MVRAALRSSPPRANTNMGMCGAWPRARNSRASGSVASSRRLNSTMSSSAR
jgi:hypothetical protein